MKPNYSDKLDTALEAIARDEEPLIAESIGGAQFGAPRLVRIGTESYYTEFSVEEACRFVAQIKDRYEPPPQLDAETKREFERRVSGWIPLIRRAIIRASN